jgi:hypothetical protein
MAGKDNDLAYKVEKIGFDSPVAIAQVLEEDLAVARKIVRAIELTLTAVHLTKETQTVVHVTEGHLAFQGSVTRRLRELGIRKVWS